MHFQANMAGGQRRAPTKQIAGTTNRGEKMTIGGQMKISEAASDCWLVVSSQVGIDTIPDWIS